jgi:hypothetical protein
MSLSKSIGSRAASTSRIAMMVVASPTSGITLTAARLAAVPHATHSHAGFLPAQSCHSRCIFPRRVLVGIGDCRRGNTPRGSRPINT